ncbi:MAG: hypothetical protein ACXWP4_02275 [Polyangiales bacterium]
MRTLGLACTLALCACSSGNTIGSGGQGTVQVFIVPEASITNGISAGTGPEDIADGWKVEYTKYLVTVGNFRARSTQTGDAIGDSTVYVLDLRNAPAGGYVISTFGGVAATRFDKVGEDMPAAKAGAKGLAPTSDADVAMMIAKGYALYFEGTMTNDAGKSCSPTKPTECVEAKTIHFKWGFAMGTSFDDCASAQGDTGFAVPSGGAVQVKPTIHGDHWFFSDITQGAEVTVRYAQFIADSDLDHDGETTLDELAKVKSADVFPSAKYKLSGTVGGAPIATAFDFVKAQARTIHDFQGDGDCPTRSILQ